MANVCVRPMPAALRAMKRFRPMAPPIFDDEPTPADIALARELFLALDAQSQEWYSRCSIFAGLLADDRRPR